MGFGTMMVVGMSGVWGISDFRGNIGVGKMSDVREMEFIGEIEILCEVD